MHDAVLAPQCQQRHGESTSGVAVLADGRVLREMYLARVKKPADSKGPWDYFEIVRRIAPEETVWPLSESKCPAAKGLGGCSTHSQPSS